jgi:hypothetical protein
MDLTINLTTGEEKERYEYIKELTTRLYPNIYEDETLCKLNEYLLVYYAKNGEFPEPPKDAADKPITITNFERIIEHHTPADVGDTLNRFQSIEEK